MAEGATVKIRMKLKILGTRDGVRWPEAGGTVTLPEHEAARLCANGLATPVVEDDTEKAVAPEGEKRRARRAEKVD
jgi:hypothetical protein